MRWYQDAKVMTKLMLGFCAVAVITLCVGVMSLNALSVEDRRFDVANKMHFEGARILADAGIKFNRMRTLTAQSLLTDDPAELGGLKKTYDDLHQSVAKDLVDAEACIVSADGKAQLAATRKAYETWNTGNEVAWQHALRMTAAENALGYKELIANKPNALAANNGLEGILQQKNDLMVAEAKKQSEDFGRTRTMLLLLVLAAVIAAIALGFTIARIIVTPLSKGVSLMEAVADGDFTQTLDIDTKDELGQLAAAMNKTVTTVRTALTSVAESASAVTIASGELSSASQSISSGAQEQASSLEETAASLEQMTSAVKQNADNAQQAAQLAQGARDVAEKGGKIVNSAVEAMTEINASSRKIADIITAIDEIAFQTNLLALNAAVEAARAGEQGRGFAVVAGEVRNLAQRSASAAKEIKGLINDSVDKVESGSKLVNQSGVTLEEIVNSVKRVTDIVGEIAASSREQSTGIEQVNTAVTQMDAVTQSNASQTEELAGTADGLSGQAQALMTLVQKFRLGDGAHVAAEHTPLASARPKSRAKVLPMRKAGVHNTRKAAPVSAPVAVVPAATGTDGFEEF
jgi:methyl-accepting chemotaxis protein